MRFLCQHYLEVLEGALPQASESDQKLHELSRCGFAICASVTSWEDEVEHVRMSIQLHAIRQLQHHLLLPKSATMSLMDGSCPVCRSNAQGSLQGGAEGGASS